MENPTIGGLLVLRELSTANASKISFWSEVCEKVEVREEEYEECLDTLILNQYIRIDKSNKGLGGKYGFIIHATQKGRDFYNGNTEFIDTLIKDI